MTIGISGKDASLIPVIWSSYSDFLDAKPTLLSYMPLVREVNIPLSFFAAPVPAVGEDTVVSYETFLVEPRNISATFVLQASQLKETHFFPFYPRDRLGIPPFYPFSLILAIVNPQPPPPLKLISLPRCILNRWELNFNEGMPATLTMGWQFSLANAEPSQYVYLGSVNANDEFLTIRNVQVSFFGDVPIQIPPDGIRQISVRVEVNCRWVHRIQYEQANRSAWDAVINSWQISVDMTLTPEAISWLPLYLESSKSLSEFDMSIYIYPAASHYYYPIALDFYKVRLLSGNFGTRVDESANLSLRVGARDLICRPA